MQPSVQAQLWAVWEGGKRQRTCLKVLHEGVWAALPHSVRSGMPTHALGRWKVALQVGSLHSSATI